MIQQSGKVAVIKKPKHATDDDNIKEEEEDIITKLPGELLFQILSLLPDADAIRSRIVSTRWNHRLSAFIPNLHFIMKDRWSAKQMNKFYNAVDQTLLARCAASVPINKLYIKYCTYNCDNTRIFNWIRNAIEYCKVREMDILFPSTVFDKLKFSKPCWDLLKDCRTLVGLTLRGGFVLDVVSNKTELFFPCLKKLSLESIGFSCDDSFANLVSGCPVLEELVFERRCRPGNVHNFRISSSSLKRLRLTFMEFGRYDHVEIDAPKLEYVYILDNVSMYYSLTNQLSLVEAHIGITTSFNDFFQSLSSVQILTLTHSTIMALIRWDDINISTPFPNLVKLVISAHYWSSGWRFLLDLLNYTPNLEHITFSDACSCGLMRYDDFRGSVNLVTAPACLRLKLKEIILRNQIPVQGKELPYIMYLLKHGTNLETFTINSYADDMIKHSQILGYQRGSSLCQIKFLYPAPTHP